MIHKSLIYKLIAFLFISTFFFNAKAQITEIELIAGINYANQSCPKKIGKGKEITSITYIRKNIIFTYTIDQKYYKIDTISYKYALQQLIKNDKSLYNISQNAAENDIGIQFIYKKRNSSDNFSVSFSANDLKQMNSLEYENQLYLQTIVEITQKKLPKKLTNGIELNDIYIKNDNLIYLMCVNESKYPLDLIKNSEDNFKSILNSSQTDIINVCKENSINIIYIFHGKQSGKEVEIEMQKSNKQTFDL